MVKGLDWMIGEKVLEINLSIAGDSNKALDISFKMASRSKTVIVAAAGNWGRADRPGCPAAFDDAVAVTAVGTDSLVYSEA
jgi:subtilisin family serine protease